MEIKRKNMWYKIFFYINYFRLLVSMNVKFICFQDVIHLKHKQQQRSDLKSEKC